MVTICLPIILYVQIFSHHYLVCIVFYTIFLLFVHKLLSLKFNQLTIVSNFADNQITKEIDDHFLYNRLNEKLIRLSVNVFRSLLLIITSIAILAVDFKSVFPVDLRKSSFYGISLMDVGVGFFIQGSAMRVIRNNSKIQPESNNDTNSFLVELGKFPRKFYLTLKGSYLILLIGLIKLLIMKALHYGSDIGEYGVHWNFFFSLFLVRVSKEEKEKNFHSSN